MHNQGMHIFPKFEFGIFHEFEDQGYHVFPDLKNELNNRHFISYLLYYLYSIHKHLKSFNNLT